MVTTPPPVDGAEGAEDENLPPGTITAFTDIFRGSQQEQPRIGGDNKPVWITALEGLCVMFWDSEYRERWMVQNNFRMPDPMGEEFVRRAQIHTGPGNDTPPPPTTRRMSIPEGGDSQIVDNAFRDADELYMRTLVENSRAMNAGFREAAADAETETAAVRTPDATVGAPIPA